MPANSSDAIKNDEKNFYKTLNKLQREMQHQKSSEFKVMSQTVFNHFQKKNGLVPVNESEYLEETSPQPQSQAQVSFLSKKDSQTNTVMRGARETQIKTDLYHTVFDTDNMMMKNSNEGISQGDVSKRSKQHVTTQSNVKTVRRESVTLKNKDTAFHTTMKGFPTPPRGSQGDLQIQVQGETKKLENQDAWVQSKRDS